MHALPTSPQELQTFLIAIFPSFSQEAEDPIEWPPEFGEFTFHTVMFNFTSFFGREVDLVSTKQLAKFGKFLQAVSLTTGALENAVSTCFLEHAHQLKVSKKLRPWLARRSNNKRDA